MKNKTILVILISIILISSTQAMSNYPSILVLEGNTSEWINRTIHFSDVPTSTLTGYEKWTIDGKTLNRSLNAEDVGVELIYPKIVNVENSSTEVNISVRTNKSGNYTGAIFYRTEGQTGIAAGTWIKINVTEKPITLKNNITDNNNADKKGFFYHIFRKFLDWIAGFFHTAEASNTTMNTTVSVIPTSTPSHKGGGGGGTPKDTDGDGISDISEMIAGTDKSNPCDPNPNCTACLALKVPTIPTTIPTVPTITPIPIVTPMQQPKVSPTPFPKQQPIILIEEKPFQWKIIAIPIGIIVAVILFLLWRGRKYEDEDEEEYYYEE